MPDARYDASEFPERLCGAGIATEKVRMTPKDDVRRGLLPNEWLQVVSGTVLRPAVAGLGAREVRG